MTNSNFKTGKLLGIADIERETGLSKDTLRVWERRYGFPDPSRDARGERCYDEAQLQRLRHIRRLLDTGYRPGRVVPLPLEQLLLLSVDTPSPDKRIHAGSGSELAVTSGVPAGAPHLAHWKDLLQRLEIGRLRIALKQYLQIHGLRALVREGIAPMNPRVGDAWAQGRLTVYQEHLYSEVVQVVLHQAMLQVAASHPELPPRVLLTTVPGESHSLGLLMAESMLRLEGCETMAFGVQMPLDDIAAAVRAIQADVVALSFSSVLPLREVQAVLASLAKRLPHGTEIWVGGAHVAGLGRRARPAPYWLMPELDDIQRGVARWRAKAADVNVPSET